MKKSIALIVAVLCFVSISATAASISGKVQCHMGKAYIPDALVILLKQGDAEFSKTVVSDATGNFFIPDVDEGKYNIEVVKDGFYKNVLFDLKIESDKNYTVNVKLLRKAKKDDSDYCFMLGGIEVQSVQKDLIPEEAVTSRKITSGEIEHMQATSLGDILSLVPGVEKTNNPGLSKETRVGIRSLTIEGTAGLLESFGSSIIVDGNPIANDANLTSRSGVDLRNIPADNIKSVEVITGIPSVEYGNFANGIIKVETKSGRVAPKLKAKFNPDTKTASFSHGLNFKKSILDYHINYGYSERNPRKEGDEFQRIHLNGTYSKILFKEKFDTKFRGSYTKLLDNEEPTDVYKTRNYKQGYRASGSWSFDYNRKEKDKITGFVGFNLNRKKTFKAKWVTDQVVLPDTIYPGYIGEMTEIGKEWNFHGKLQRKISFIKNGTSHKILYGLETDYQENSGEGVLLDTLFNYYGLYSMRRSYSYYSFPDVSHWSFYFEDVISETFLGNKYILMVGLRYDVFNPNHLNSFKKMVTKNAFMESDHGDFLSPRINWQYFITEDFRVRLGVGKSAKGVSLGYIYRPPAFFKYQQDTVIVEEMHLQYNPDLHTYSTTKYESSIDWRVSDLLGLSLTGYYSESKDRPSSVSYPWGYDVNPDTITAASYSIYDNRGWQRSSGAEFTLRTKRIRNLQYKMNITYRFSKSGTAGLKYDPSPASDWEEIWYPSSSSWREKIIINYQLNYISKRLGVWVTLDVQQTPLENKKTIYRSNSGMKEVDGLEEEQLFYQSMNYWYDKELFSYGDRWLFNFRVSKSLSNNTELSLYINNVFDDRGVWKHPYTGRYSEKNPEIYYGLEVSTQW